MYYLVNKEQASVKSNNVLKKKYTIATCAYFSK
jgi:hypothetical protein